MAKLLKEAKRLKMILSANVDHRAQVSNGYIHSLHVVMKTVVMYEYNYTCQGFYPVGGQGEASPQILQFPSQNFKHVYSCDFLLKKK